MAIRRRYKSGGWQVQVGGFPAVSLPTRQAALKVEADLKLRRTMGALYEEPPIALGAALDGYIAAKQALDRLSPRALEALRQSRRFWVRFEKIKLTALRRVALEDALAERAAEHSRSAQMEQRLLLATLRWAQGRGQRFDPRLLDLPPVKDRPRRGRAITVAQVWELSSWFPEHVRRLVPLAGFVGARQHFWFALDEGMLDLDGGRLVLPAELQKNRLPHMIYLAPVEVRLLREQLVARPAGTRLVFPTSTGRSWDRHSFRVRAWEPAVRAAAREHPVFEGFTFHLLRHTAGSLMAAAGMDVSAAAERMGHTDGGALFLRTYRHLFEAERRAAALRFGETLEQLPKEATA